MEPRTVLKSLRDFARRELAEKKAELVVVYRMKMKQLIRRGVTPEFRVKGVEGTQFLICVFQGDNLRAYFMGGNGAMLGAEDFRGEEREKILSEISRGGRTVFRFS